jgi:hypothetical protein
MNNKGQSILVEYVTIFFVVIAGLVAMTAFVQRSLEARVHDGRNFMIASAVNACDANCLQATGGKIAYEYEPYYMQMTADVQRNEQENSGQTTGNPAVLGAVYMKASNVATQTISNSVQRPSECANGGC